MDRPHAPSRSHVRAPAVRAVRFALPVLLALALLAGVMPIGAPADAQDGIEPPFGGDPEFRAAIEERRQTALPPGVPEPIDPESWSLPDWLTWDDYNPVPGVDWRDVDDDPEVQFRGALVLGDFTDTEFYISQPAGSQVFDLPPEDLADIPRDELASWFSAYLSVPTEHNGFRTIDEFWRENTYGRFGIDVDAFGPYRMDGKKHEYGLNEFGQQQWCPEGDTCDGNFMAEARQRWVDDVGQDLADEYDFVFFTNPGFDESSVWQEFGEMIFLGPDDVPDAFGPPDENLPNWAGTRYVDWTSWYAASSLWSRAASGASLQSESSGQSTYAHEFSHILGVPDNYNNPYGDPVSRSYTGPWANLSRGTFNGPGGPHTRWLIPPNQGSSTSSHHMLRNKMGMGLMDLDQVVDIDREMLAQAGPVVTDLWPRALPIGEEFGRTGVRGLNVAIDTDHTPDCSLEDDYRCQQNSYHNFTVEVVDQIGYDSFAHDTGTLITKTRDDFSLPWMWVVDANPDLLEIVDFERPDGSDAMVSPGDYRQLANALFKAGNDELTKNEFLDDDNRLHFYVLDTVSDDEGAMHYRVGVRNLDEDSGIARGVEVADPEPEGVTPGRAAMCPVEITNTGQGADVQGLEEVPATMQAESSWELPKDGLLADPAIRDRVEELRAGGAEAGRQGGADPLDASGEGLTDEMLGRDIYRVSTEHDSAHWQVTLPNNLIDLAAAETGEIEVYVWRDGPTRGEHATSVDITIASESDASAAQTVTCDVHVSDTRPRVPGS